MIELESLIPWRRVRGWKCVRCGFCCSTYDIPVSIDEEVRLRKYGNVFRKGKLGLYLKRKKGVCIFKAKWGCKIYDERPLACVLYPFYIRNTGEEEAKFTYNGVVYFVYLDKNLKRHLLDEKFEIFYNNLSADNQDSVISFAKSVERLVSERKVSRRHIDKFLKNFSSKNE